MADNDLSSQIEAVQTKLRYLLNTCLNSIAPDRPEMIPLQQVSELLLTLESAVSQQHQQYTQLQDRYQQLGDQYRREHRLIMVMQQLSESLNPLEIAEQTVMAVRQLLAVDRVAIYQFKTSGEAVAVAESGMETASFPGTIPPEQAQALVQICQQRGVVTLDRVDSTRWVGIPSELIPFMQSQTATSLIVVPIGQKKMLRGLIAAQQQEDRVWQPFEMDLLQQLSTEVAIALSHSELYQQSQRLNVDLERQVQQRTEQLKNALDYESMLKRITDRVRDSLDERTILEAAVQELTVILNIAGCNAALYDLNQGTSTIHYEYTQSIPTSQGRVAQMENFPEIYQQLQQGLTFQFCSLLYNPARGRVAMLACPIFVDPQSSRGVNQSVLGDLWLIHHKDHIFDEHEIRLVQQVASQCAIAIRQARLYQAAQGQVKELAELNRLKDEFLSTVSHELRTPITNIKMAIQMLRNAATEERRNQYLGILDQEAIREADLINDLLDLQQLQASSRQLETETLTLQTWLSELIEPFRPRFAARQLVFQMDYASDLPTIDSEAAALQRILTELLNNACKYTAPGHQIQLLVATVVPDTREESASHIRFRIRNQASIPEVEIPKLFDKFYRCPNADPWKQGGTGLGLALVKKLTERLQGTIEVSSDAGWTQFTVTLPLVLKTGAESSLRMD